MKRRMLIDRERGCMHGPVGEVGIDGYPHFEDWPPVTGSPSDMYPTASVVVPTNSRTSASARCEDTDAGEHAKAVFPKR